MRSTRVRAAVTDTAKAPVPVFVGGVSELYQSDLDVGRCVVERLLAEDLGSGVVVEDLYYGAIMVAQRLEDLRPTSLILVSGVVRGRPPGTVQRRYLEAPEQSAADVQGAVGDAITGYVHPDLVVEIAAALKCLPARSIAIEIEPEAVTTGDGLSPCVAEAVDVACEMVRAEVRRAPLLALADELRPLLEGDRLEESAPTASARELLDELRLLEREGRWGRSFALKDRLQLGIAGSDSSEGMSHLDWALWWTLIEEVARLEVAETAYKH